MSVVLEPGKNGIAVIDSKLDSGSGNGKVAYEESLSVDDLALKVRDLLEEAAKNSPRIAGPAKYRIDPGRPNYGVGTREVTMGWSDNGIEPDRVGLEPFPNRVVISILPSFVNVLGFERSPFIPLPELISRNFPSEALTNPEGRIEMLLYMRRKIISTTLPIDQRYSSRK